MTGAHADVVGVLLAAGAGRRMGQPKALVTAPDGTPWVVAAARTLRAAGCATTYVVIGAAAEQVRELLASEPVTIVEAANWADGMGASLKAGLDAIADRGAAAALIHLVDLPDVNADVIARMLGHAAPDRLARATYGPTHHGHPVLIGRDHWAPIAAEARGDAGARDYLARHEVTEIECADLATGTDVDRPGPMLEG